MNNTEKTLWWFNSRGGSWLFALVWYPITIWFYYAIDILLYWSIKPNQAHTKFPEINQFNQLINWIQLIYQSNCIDRWIVTFSGNPVIDSTWTSSESILLWTTSSWPAVSSRTFLSCIHKFRNRTRRITLVSTWTSSESILLWTSFKLTCSNFLNSSLISWNCINQKTCNHIDRVSCNHINWVSCNHIDLYDRKSCNFHVNLVWINTTLDELQVDPQ